MMVSVLPHANRVLEGHPVISNVHRSFKDQSHKWWGVEDYAELPSLKVKRIRRTHSDWCGVHSLLYIKFTFKRRRKWQLSTMHDPQLDSCMGRETALKKKRALLRQLINWEQVLHIRKYYWSNVKFTNLIVTLWFSKSCSNNVLKYLRVKGHDVYHQPKWFRKKCLCVACVYVYHVYMCGIP